jgi:hypothetical protein
MTTYRAEHGVTVVRNATGAETGWRESAQTVAVVVNGDQALAERIAWLLTHACPTCMGPQRETVDLVCQTCGTDYASTPDVDHTRGAAEALALVADRIAELGFAPIRLRTLRELLERVSAELGLDGDAPSSPSSAPLSASDALGVVVPGSGDSNALETAYPARYWGEHPAPKNGTASRPPGWACPRHGVVI